MCDTNVIKCTYCERTFTAKKNMYRHIRNFHKDDENEKKSENQICPLCKGKYHSINDVQSHFKDTHPEVNLVYHTETFYCMDHFYDWKIKTEKDSKSFVKHRGDQLLFDGRLQINYFCNRSGSYEINADRKRRLKRTGIIKTGITCPAHIVAVKDSENEAVEIKVTYQSVHVGHTQDIGLMPLTKDERELLAGKMSLGIPCAKILSNLRKEFSPTKRLSLTNQKDLRNIFRDYNIDQEVVFHKNDAISVDVIVKNMQAEEYNPVLIYKPIGEVLTGYSDISRNEFLLGVMNSAQQKLLELYGNNILMIDSTHGTNQYGFQLTLMVADSNHEGFPVAILYSTRTTEKTFIPFFQEIKNRVLNVEPFVFMSDDAPAFYNSFKHVFGDVVHYLICSWHIKRAWNSNLVTKIKNKDIRANVKKEIMIMLEETDLIAFKRISVKIVSKLLSSDDTKSFGQYLNSYMNRAEQWAYCHRTNLQINTNMKVERWHRDIKYEEAGGKVIKRLDKSLSIVLSAVTKKLMGRIVSMERGKLTSKIAEIRKRQDRCKLLNMESVTETVPDLKWTVASNKASSSSTPLKTYDVSFIKRCACKIKCDECNICIHSFACTCPDYSIRFVICKHIHLVCQKFLQKEPVVSSLPEILNNNLLGPTNEVKEQMYEEHAAINKEIKKKVLQNSDLETKRSAVISELQSLIKDCQTTQNTEMLKIVEESIRLIKVKTQALPDNIPRLPDIPLAVKLQPCNKNISVQRTLSIKPKSLKRQRTD